ncbi:hypothetical protein [Dyella japonica]|uniref:hypothetical protein n=1 Tax=Dyella japonica TaxID=231455 RepID=UPI00118654C1|nr:hypothetical protein [Dyella japonica]
MKLSFIAVFSAFLVACLFSPPSRCEVPLASVESAELKAIPSEINSMLIRSKSFGVFAQLNCQTKGVELGLSENKSNRAWFVTTADGCGWGAAMGPIWIVGAMGAHKVSVLLCTGGYSITASKGIHKGMVDIVISGGTAGREESATYIYNGKSYVRKKLGIAPP